MLNFQSKQIVVTVLVIAMSGLFILTGCQRDGQITPIYVPVASPPVEVTIDQLLSDYVSDEVATDAKYKDKRLLFTNVEVEEIKIDLMVDCDAPTIYIVCNGVEFRPKFDIGESFVGEGFVVDIIGEVYGWFGVANRYLVVENCWIKIIEGDVGSLEEIY